jgi:two-component sensor histidine kinase
MPIIFFTVEKLVGVINVQTEAAHDFTTDDVTFLEIVAGQLAMNIGNGRLYEQTDETLRRKVHELSTIQSVSGLVASTLELKQVLELIVMKAVQLSEADRSIIFQLDRVSQRLRPVAMYGFENARLENATVPVGQCCAGRAARSGEPSLALDCMRTDEGCFFHHQAAAIEHQHAVLCVPLVSTHGVQGALCVYSAQRYLLSSHQLRLVVTFANVAAVAMDNARLFEQTREGLKTKSMLMREMHHRVKNNLQQVGAILHIRQRRVDSPQAKRVLMEIYERIVGIAEIHDLLSRDHFGVAPVDVIARKIVGVVQAHLMPPNLHLKFEVDPCPVLLRSEEATTLAIVINELIANAIEHGFAGRAHGRIRISGQEHDGTTTICVADDGLGLPPDFAVEASDRMGLTVIRNLVELSLQGTFTLRRELATPPEPTEAGAGESGAGWTIAEIAFLTPASDALSELEDAARVNA